MINKKQSPDMDPAVSLNQEWAIKAFQMSSEQQVSSVCNLPFSFVYDGKPSTEIIPSWKSEVDEIQVDEGTICRTLTLTDPDTGLEVKAVAKVYTDTPGVDWILYFTNKGSRETPVIEQVQAVDISIAPDAGEVTLHRLHGTMDNLEDFLPFDESVTPGEKIEFAPSEGRSSDVAFPFFNLDWGTGGVITAIGWTGQWCASVERMESSDLLLQAGMQFMHLKLQPGETIRSPRILQIHWTGSDHIISYNLFRQTMMSHIMPKIEGKPVTPPIAHMSTYFEEGLLQSSTEAGVLACIEIMQDMQFEAVWIDACWMFRYGMGDYGFPIERVEDRRRFPGGLKPVGDAAHKAGMSFIVWFCPEDVLPGTYLTEEHPEWIIYPGIQEGAPARNEGGYGMFDLSIPEAREYMTRYLKEAIKEYRMDCLRVDRGWFGGPLPCWRIKDGDDSDRIGISEIRGVQGLYAMWDEILSEYPDLFIDNCAGGGRRIDLETCARSIPLWITDATSYAFLPGSRTVENYNKVSIQNQVMIAGLGRYLPSISTGVMGIDPYWWRSGFSGGIAFCEDIRPDDFPGDEIRKAIKEWKRIRPYYYGNFYPLSEITMSPSDWCVTQYHLPQRDAGIVLAFRRHESPHGSFTCGLRDIEVDSEYKVTFSYTFNQEKPLIMKGSDLLNLRIEIVDTPGSLLVEYEKINEINCFGT